MSRKRLTAEQIIIKLREAEVGLAPGIGLQTGPRSNLEGGTTRGVNAASEAFRLLDHGTVTFCLSLSRTQRVIREWSP